MKTTATLLAFLVCAASSSAFGQTTEARTERVRYDDLNLSGPNGRAILEQRVAHAVDQVCLGRPQPMELERQAAYRACATEAMAGAREQLAQLFDQHQLAEAHVVVFAPRR